MGMTDDLMTQVRTLLDEGAAPIALDELPSGGLAQPVRVRRRRRSSLIAIAVGVIAACAIAVTVAVSMHDRGPTLRLSPGAARVPVADAPLASADVVVYMSVNASADETAAVSHAVATSPQVRQFAALSHDDAYEEFSQLFACNADLVHSIAPKDLPESFRLTLTAPDAASSAEGTLRSLPGVDTVTTGAAEAANTPACEQTIGH
jgi:cell division transport system permease protein